MLRKLLYFIMRCLIGAALISLYICINTPVAFSRGILGVGLVGSFVVMSIYEIIMTMVVKKTRSVLSEEDDEE